MITDSPFGSYGQLLRAPSIATDPGLNTISAVAIMAGGILFTAVAALGGSRGEGIFGNLFYFSGLSVWTLCLILAAGGISRSVLLELEGKPRMELSQVGAYLAGKWKTLTLIPLAFCGLALAGIVVQTFMAIVGAVPWIGPILYAVSFPMAVALSMLVILTTLVHILGSPLYPAALGSREAGATEVIRELFELVRLNPGRILLVEGALALLCGGLTLTIATLLRAALRLTVAISHPAMQERFLRIVAGVPEPLYPLFERLAGPFPFYFATGDAPAFYPVAGFLLGLSFLGLVAVAFAYPLTLLITGGTVLYASLRTPPGQEPAAGP